jgi:ligand-binding sensor domain-containing protein/two-component sensor histidine kinase
VGGQPFLHTHRSVNGVFWAITDEAIYRFEGTTKTAYTKSTGNNHSTPSSDISGLLESSTGELILATEDMGLIVYSPTYDRFDRYTWNGNPTTINKSVSAAAAGNDDDLWIAYATGQATRLDPVKRRRTDYLLAKNVRITSVTASLSGDIFASSGDGRIFLFDEYADSFAEVQLGPSCKTSIEQLRTISTLDGITILAGTRNNGVVSISIHDGTCRILDLNTPESIKKGGIYTNHIFQDAITAEAWISTDSGLFILHNEKVITSFHKNGSALAVNEVIQVSKGNDGVRWVSTYAGLYSAIRTPFQLFDRKNHKSINEVIDLDQSANNDIWVATYSGLFLYSNQSRTFLPLSEILQDANLHNQRITAFSADATELWVGYLNAGLEHYSLKDGALTKYGTNSAPSLSADAITNILVTSGNETLIGTFEGGLNVIKANGEVKVINPLSKKNPRPLESVFMLFETSEGAVWVGTNFGHYIFDTATYEVKEVAPLAQSSNTSLHSPAWTMNETSNGDLWLGTQHQGLYRIRADSLNREPEKYRLQGKDEGTAINAIEVDKNDIVWLSTNNGITRIDPANDTVHNFTQAHGLQETNFEFGASHIDKMGNIYFGGTNGYNRFNPEEIHLEATIPQIVLTDVLINGVRRALPKQDQMIGAVELTYNNNSIHFNFSVIDYIDPFGNLYRYKLDNFDNSWTEAGKRNSATYTNLPAGDYTLHVQGANSIGTWNREGISVNIKVLSAPWYTPWAFAGYFLLLCLAAWIAKKYYDNYTLRKEAIRLAEEMTHAADLAMDTLQEDLDHRDNVLDSLYQQKIITLDLVSEFLRFESPLIDEQFLDASTEKNLHRIQALRTLEECLFPHDEFIMADLRRYTDKILDALLKRDEFSLLNVTTINNVAPHKLPVHIASPLAIVIYELAENALAHALSPSAQANYLQVSLEWSKSASGEQDCIELRIQDNGQSHPEGMNVDIPTTSGLGIVKRIASKLCAALEFSFNKGTTVSLTITDPFELR